MVKSTKLVDDFKRLIERDRLSHAYLFFGGNESDKEEKFLFAKSLANFLERGAFDVPERELTELLVIDENEEGAIAIDEVRVIRHFLYQTPVASKYRILIIKNGESLTPEARNAILKIVEEPPTQALIILIVRNEDGLPSTLSSRLQKIHFPADSETVVEQDINWRNISIDDIIENKQLDQFFSSLIVDLMNDPIENSKKLKETLRSLTVIKQFNTNKRLQLKRLRAYLP